MLWYLLYLRPRLNAGTVGIYRQRTSGDPSDLTVPAAVDEPNLR